MQHGNKKKKQKMRKKAELQQVQKDRREREEIDALKKIASEQTPAASPALREASTCRIIVRSTRAIRQGEEILISYLPTSQPEFRLKEARQEYLKKHYLFECRCAKCEPKPDAAPAP
jgi:stress response protein YsnF